MSKVNESWLKSLQQVALEVGTRVAALAYGDEPWVLCPLTASDARRTNDERWRRLCELPENQQWQCAAVWQWGHLLLVQALAAAIAFITLGTLIDFLDEFRLWT